MIHYDFVTDPDDPLVTDLLTKLLNTVKDVSEINLDRGLIRYVFNFDNDEINSLGIDEIVNEISYVPITVTSYNTENESETSNLVKVFIERIIKTEISQVIVTRFEDYIVFNPITTFGTSVYQNSSYLFDFYNTIMKIGKYQVLSDNPLAQYVYLNSINVNGISLVLINDNVNITETRNDIDNLESEGYFCLNTKDNEVIKELAKSWDTHIVFESEDLLVLQSNTDFGTKPELWFQNNIELVKNGQFPSITLYGNWQFDLGGDYNDIYDKKWYRTILQYKAFVAYKNLNDNPINPYIFATRVNSDNSVTLSLPTYDHVIKFRKIFEGINNDGIYVEPCSNLIDGIVKKYYIQGIDENSFPMVLKQGDEEILVFRSPLINLYPPVFDFSKLSEKELEEKLKDYYSNCHDNFEPVLQEDINNMSLSDLLNLVEINENGVTFCLSGDSIINLSKNGLATNPLTRKPFGQNILLKTMMWEWGLRGLFDVSVLKGLLNEFPK